MKSKFALSLTVAFAGLAALSIKPAYSDELFCSDWSFNTPGCPAYIERKNINYSAYTERKSIN